jgi:hypothetical protein
MRKGHWWNYECRGKPKILRKKPGPLVPLYLSQIPYGLAWAAHTEPSFGTFCFAVCASVCSVKRKASQKIKKPRDILFMTEQIALTTKSAVWFISNNFRSGVFETKFAFMKILQII